MALVAPSRLLTFDHSRTVQCRLPDKVGRRVAVAYLSIACCSRLVVVVVVVVVVLRHRPPLDTTQQSELWQL